MFQRSDTSTDTTNWSSFCRSGSPNFETLPLIVPILKYSASAVVLTMIHFTVEFYFIKFQESFLSDVNLTILSKSLLGGGRVGIVLLLVTNTHKTRLHITNIVMMTHNHSITKHNFCCLDSGRAIAFKPDDESTFLGDIQYSTHL